MNKNRCIYIAFYTKLANYDNRDCRSKLRRDILDCCVRSYKINNPNVLVIVDIIDEPMANTADMYFDKMRRIKDLNYVYDVLWVDGDTICLQNIEDIFDNDKMCAVHWVDHGSFLNVINGGFVYYPRRYLYDNWDWFTMQWIKLLSGIYIEKQKHFGCETFTGIHEQIPITNLLLKQINESVNFENYNLIEHKDFLLHKKILLNYAEYNYNPMFMHFYYSKCDTFEKTRGFATIANKKILHFNLSVALSDIFQGLSIDIDYVFVSNYIIDNLIGYMHDVDVLRARCEELKISNNNLIIENNNESCLFRNPTLGIYRTYEVMNENSDEFLYKSNGLVFPGCYLANGWGSISTKTQLVKNFYSGEETWIKRPE